MKRILWFLALWLVGCAIDPPPGVKPVSDFDLDRYLGHWYEIARLDHVFERGLSEVTATYELGEDGGVRVRNRGYDARIGTWKEAEGHAAFVGAPTVGSLKVSFFGPFYGGYHIIALDQEQYAWAMIAGPSRDYLWILARIPQLPPDVQARLLAQAQALGFATDQLIWVRHHRDDAHRP